MLESFPCPKCKRTLERSGVVTVDSVGSPVFQCDTCTRSFQMEGQTFDEAYTFAVDSAGQVFDPGA